MKILIYITAFLLTLTAITFSQSVIEFDSGTALTIDSGANICADNIIINGTFTGGGTICGNTPLTILNITVIPEGYLYAASINTTRSNIKDKSSIFLRSSTAPYSVVDLDTVEIDSITLTGTCFFNNAPPGSYYVVVQHRNSIETWSSNPVSVSANLTSYDFTSASSMAYGNNMVLKLGKWCTFSGDVNQDGLVDIADIFLCYNAGTAFLTGYVNTDVNGDGLVDILDALITFNNANNFVAVIRP